MTIAHPQRQHLTRIPVWLPLEAEVIYFFTACCADRRPVFANPGNVRLAVECLQRTEQRLGWQVLKACLMPDHVHLLLAPLLDRDAALSKFSQRWKSCVTLRLKGRATEPVWQREFFDRLLRSEEKLAEKWEYVRANPVRAGLCAQPEEYPYSGTPSDILERLVTA